MRYPADFVSGPIQAVRKGLGKPSPRARSAARRSHTARNATKGSNSSLQVPLVDRLAQVAVSDDSTATSLPASGTQPPEYQLDEYNLGSLDTQLAAPFEIQLPVNLNSNMGSADPQPLTNDIHPTQSSQPYFNCALPLTLTSTISIRSGSAPQPVTNLDTKGTGNANTPPQYSPPDLLKDDLGAEMEAVMENSMAG